MTSSMNIRMDNEVKAQAQAIFAQFGLDMTTAINMFLRQAIRTQSIPFRISLRPDIAEEAMAVILED
ncbi:MAG: type II toxin-antitoxin system RelB/DinJ family antitoxin [Oscillospiraceae bacterium]|nr:type II toxin-antitoxin system RelB/DinJ family antitoxin [Oscillospiraceae bacterium]